HDLHVLLRVEGELLRALCIVHRHLVVAAATRRAVRLDATDDFLAGQAVRRHRLTVVDATDDDRLIGIALEEIHDHFLADAWDGHAAPALAGPDLRHAHPARTALVELAVAVPVKLHFDPRVFVGVNLLAFRADDDRRLRALHKRFRGDALRTIRRIR